MSRRPRTSGGGFESLIERGELSVGALLLALVIADVLGRGARAHAGTRQGDGRRLPRRHEGDDHATRSSSAAPSRSRTPPVSSRSDSSRSGCPRSSSPSSCTRGSRSSPACSSSPSAPRSSGSDSRSRGHHHHHHHGHEAHTTTTTTPHHDHHHDDALTSKGILGVGVAAGLLPCPSALVVLLSAIALHRIGLGLALIVAFSLGLAATITAIGLVAVLARRTFGRLSLDGPLVRALPAVSAALILAVGLVITARALPGVV